MSTNRAVLGALPGGGFGLRVSLPGFDCLTDDPTDVNKFSFNSDWTDLIRTLQVGVVSFTVLTPTNVFFPTQSFIPFMEVRQADASNAYDDRPINYSGNSHSTQAVCTVANDRFVVTNNAAPGSVFYIVFKEAA